ncbi:hypothetical protein [Benzoatithermus flavus]|uniref:Helicase ATP-binding domain-containing protein n=1 Tax=Benzoatithermus flavus TaxID=3108223 RepID=A0ABU8XTE8_9PROT
MFDFNTIRSTFHTLRVAQVTGHKGSHTTFDAKIDGLIWRVSELALKDRLEGKPRIRVGSAPTGSGKTMASLALVAAGIMTDPTFTAGLVVEQMRQADDLYRHLLKLLPKELHGAVAVFTSAHDAEGDYLDDEDAKIDLGFIPAARFTREDLRKARIAIGCHQSLLGSSHKNGIGGLTFCGDERRSIVFVDETPTLVSILAVDPTALTDAWKLVDDYDKAHPWLPLLAAVKDRAQAIFQAAANGPALDAPQLVTEDDDVSVIGKPEIGSLLRFVPAHVKDRHAAAEGLAVVLEFIKTAQQGYTFFYRQPPKEFVAYRLNFRPFPGLVILDATADLANIEIMAPGLERVAAPRVDYRNLRVYHLTPPEGLRGNLTTLFEKESNCRKYAAWVRQMVATHTTPGETVLVIVKKKLVEGKHIPAAHSLEDAWEVDGRRVLVMTWGAYIGANWAKEATTVFQFGEFWPRKSVVVGTVLGLRGQRFKDATDIGSALGSTMTGDYATVRDNHLCRWAAQLAARGSMRVIDQDGVASPMRLFVTMPIERAVRLVTEVWHGARPPVILGGEQEGVTKIDRLARLLATTEDGVLWYPELAKVMEVEVKHLVGMLKNPKVATVLKAYGWQEARRKDFGLAGKGKGLCRLPSLLAA